MNNDLVIEFISKQEQHSEYDWANISLGSERVGKARCLIQLNSIIIYSITIYPEYEGRGFGKDFVDYCKQRYPKVIADRVRHSAIGFWEKMGFSNIDSDTWEFNSKKIQQ